MTEKWFYCVCRLFVLLTRVSIFSGKQRRKEDCLSVLKHFTQWPNFALSRRVYKTDRDFRDSSVETLQRRHRKSRVETTEIEVVQEEVKSLSLLFKFLYWTIDVTDKCLILSLYSFEAIFSSIHGNISQQIAMMMHRFSILFFTRITFELECVIKLM